MTVEMLKQLFFGIKDVIVCSDKNEEGTEYASAWSLTDFTRTCPHVKISKVRKSKDGTLKVLVPEKIAKELCKRPQKETQSYITISLPNSLVSEIDIIAKEFEISRDDVMKYFCKTSVNKFKNPLASRNTI